MQKKPLSKEQVIDLIDFINSGKWVDFGEVIRYNGYTKLTYIEVSIDDMGLVTTECKEPDFDELKKLTPVYQHGLYKSDLAILGEEVKGCPIKWELKSHKYTMPRSKKLNKALIEALEAHVESCDFDDFYEAYNRRAYTPTQWTEAEIRKAIREALPKDEKYVFFDIYGECQELYCYDDLNELFLSLMIDRDMCNTYERVSHKKAVEILYCQLTGRTYLH